MSEGNESCDYEEKKEDSEVVGLVGLEGGDQRYSQVEKGIGTSKQKKEV